MYQKRILSLSLALLLCFSLTSFALADEEPDAFEPAADFYEQTEDVLLTESFEPEINEEEAFEAVELPGESAPAEPSAPAETEEAADAKPAAAEEPAAELTEEASGENQDTEETKEIILEEGRTRVHFDCNPKETRITLYATAETKNEAGEIVLAVLLHEDGQPIVIAPEEDGSYLLVPGAYLYDAECEGYVSLLKATLNVTVS